MFEVSFVFNKICLTTIMFNRETIIWSLQTWQRPTLPHLKMQYHRRWRFSRPSSGWDRVQALRYNHQVSKDQITTQFRISHLYWVLSKKRADRVYSISLVYAANSRWSAFVSLSHQRLRWRPVRIIRQHHVLMLVWIDHYTWRLVEQPVYLRKQKDLKPVEQLVSVSFTHCCASTPDLSTWWSSTALKGILVSRLVSRLDAFSGYPFRT